MNVKLADNLLAVLFITIGALGVLTYAISIWADWKKRKKIQKIIKTPVVEVKRDESPARLDTSYEAIAGRFLIHGMNNARSDADRERTMEMYNRMMEKKQIKEE